MEGTEPGDDQGPEELADGLLTRRDFARLGVAGLLMTSVGSVLPGCKTGSTPGSTTGSNPRSATRSPNVLLIVADDMRYDHLQYMPNVTRLIAEEGVTFEQARCNVPLCQPTRVGLLTGQTSKYNNEIGVGFSGTRLVDHDNGIGKWMSAAGYRCGFFGKYVNFTDGTGGIDAPAGWDTWRELTVKEVSAEYPFYLHLNRGTATIDDQYSTDYLASEAGTFMKGGQPFFSVVTPAQPHAPFKPRADLAGKWLDFKWPILDEVDVSDKPSWIRSLPPLTAADRAQIQADAVGALQELSAVDDMVLKILTDMDPAVLADTVVIFTSDNGVHHGEHRRRGAATKGGPYDVGLRVPLLVRGPGFAPGPAVTVPSLVAQDIAATVLDVGDATARLPHQGGTSLVELTTNPTAHADRILLHEISEGYEKQTGDGISTGPENSRGFRKLYRYPSVRVNPKGPFTTYEAYDLDTDPDELANWADDPGRRGERDALEKELDALLRA